MANLDWIALHAANEIESIIADELPGGPVRRKARIQVVVREAMRKAENNDDPPGPVDPPYPPPRRVGN